MMFDPKINIHPRDELELSLITLVLAAATVGRSIILSYRDEDDIATGREIIPVAVERSTRGDVYLKAWCLTRNNWRGFRLDRMVGASNGNALSHPLPFVTDSEVLASIVAADGTLIGFATGPDDWQHTAYPQEDMHIMTTAWGLDHTLEARVTGYDRKGLTAKRITYQIYPNAI